MITIEDQFVIRRPLGEVWDFFDDFAGLAGCVPTLLEFAIVGENHIEGKVGVTLGAIPVTSKVRLQIKEKRRPQCIQALGVSYLGETIATQLTKNGDKEKYAAADAGQLYLHLDLRAEDGSSTRVMLCAGVEAEGRLRKIYESIIRLKVPAMKLEFRERVSRALATHCHPVDDTHAMCSPIDTIRTRVLDGPSDLPASVPLPLTASAQHPARSTAPAPPQAQPPIGAVALVAGPDATWWSRVVAWIRALVAARRPAASVEAP